MNLDSFPAEAREIASWLALHRIPGVGPATFQRLLTQFRSPEAVFANVAQATGISPRTRAALLAPDWSQVAADVDWFAEPDRYVVTLQDPRYPILLKELPEPPSILFLQGNPDLLSHWQLAIVGSRNPSASGRETAFEFARYLAGNGIAITSGLALGIDAAAHQGALAAAGPTIAVVGTGLDVVYPARHRELTQEIAQTGLLVSEFPLGVTPRPENFPRRNRILSGLSLGTLVVEAALRSGSLITARMAMEQGREVFAIPGSIHNPLVRGCHRLIREGAKLVETAEDIVEELGALAGVLLEDVSREVTTTTATGAAQTERLGEDYEALMVHLGFDPIAIDLLVEKSGLTAEAVSSMLLLLELQGRVESLVGGRYVRI